jgi:hypothetical protein
MKRILVLTAIAALVMPATGYAKGPSGASINGPGTGSGLKIGGDGESGGTPLGGLTQDAGFFPAVWGQQPDPMLKDPPKGTLGPKYTITYTVPGPAIEPSKLKQDVYPYAQPYPVTYMKAGQTFWGSNKTHGGWFVSTAALKTSLISAGLPRVAPSVSSSAGDGFFSAGMVSILAAGLALLLGASAAIFLRRRTRPATAS